MGALVANSLDATIPPEPFRNLHSKLLLYGFYASTSHSSFNNLKVIEAFKRLSMTHSASRGITSQ